MKVIYVGNVLPKEIFSEISNATPSANNLEYAIVQSLDSVFKENLSVITNSYEIPKNYQWRVPEREMQLEFGKTIKGTGYFNFKIIKSLSNIISTTISLLKLGYHFRKNSLVDNITLVIYNPYIKFSLPAYITSKIFKCEIITIIADIVDVRIVSTKNNIFKNLIYYLTKYILSENQKIITFCKWSVKDYAPKVPYLLSFHSIYSNQIETKKYEKYYLENRKFNILYTGLLHSCYGIDEILKSMDILPSNYHLTICGRGDQEIETRIIEKSNRNPRINFKGFISQADAINLQLKADILFLIRTENNRMDRYLANYASPSKLPEYLKSGTPIVASRIRAIPDELGEFINYVEDTNPESIAELILNLTSSKLEWDKALEKSTNGVNFVMDNCLWDKQSKKMINFITGS